MYGRPLALSSTITQLCIDRFRQKSAPAIMGDRIPLQVTFRITCLSKRCSMILQRIVSEGIQLRVVAVKSHTRWGVLPSISQAHGHFLGNLGYRSMLFVPYLFSPERRASRRLRDKPDGWSSAQAKARILGHVVGKYRARPLHCGELPFWVHKSTSSLI